MQISYGASSSAFGDRSIFGTFFRTSHSNKQLGNSLASLVAHFGWSCINVITSRDIFHLGLAENLKQDFKSRNICVAIDHVVANSSEITRLVSDIKDRRSVVVNVLLVREDLVVKILDEAKKLNLSRMVWIGSDARGKNLRLAKSYHDVIDGMLWVSSYEEDLGEFNAHTSWVSRNISGAFCRWLEKNSRWPAFCDRELNSQESSTGLQGLALIKIAYVVNAVLAITYGLEYIAHCDSRESVGLNCMVGNFSLHLARKHLLRILEYDSFINNRNMNVSFNANRELSAHYEILNVRVTNNKTLVPFRVGKWTQNQKLIMNESDIRWPGNKHKVPYSGCREPCPAGTKIKYGFDFCWWSCEKCPYGTYNDNTTTCKPCAKEQMPNGLQSACVKKPLTIINSGEHIAIILLSACGLGEMLTLFVVGVIIRYQDTPVVKGTNLTFTMLSLIVILSWFLVPILYVGEPSDVICKVRKISLAVLYTAITSMLLTKTNRLIKIFSAINIKKHPFLSNCWYGFLTCALILVQLGLSVFDEAVFPPNVVYDYSALDSVVVKCSANLILDISSLGYNVMLSITCSLVAYQSRNLPRAYNEFKWICLAMFANFLSWLTILINRHVLAVSKTNLICTIVALVLGAYSTLFLLFFPKVRTIFFRPEKNTKQAAKESTRRYSLEQASGIDLSPSRLSTRRNTFPACLALQFMNGSAGKLAMIKSHRACPEERKSNV